jgi:uncharacterized BrkB/YihY/UPF0761 family membrane protein
VLLLVWLGFFAQLVLYGAALNVELDRRRQGRRGRTSASRPTEAPEAPS